MDSMINHYTANRKRRNADAYSPGGEIGRRPDRANAVYAQRCREAFKGVPVVAGGVEASLRRVAHYDYWSDRVMPSSLVSSKADLVAFGTGERRSLEIARRLDRGESSPRPAGPARRRLPARQERGAGPRSRLRRRASDGATVELPSLEEVAADRPAFARATRLLHRETNPLNARRLVQRHGDRRVVINPPPHGLSEAEMDAVHELPYTRLAAPELRRRRRDPRLAHDRRLGADHARLLRRLHLLLDHAAPGPRDPEPQQGVGARRSARLAERPDFKGHISDLGGPTANMYRMRCSQPEAEAKCRRLSCVSPKVCKLLDTDHAPLVELMRESRKVKGVKKVHIASGIRMDLARNETRSTWTSWSKHHVGGHLKVAPEHVSDRVLAHMKKPPQATFEEFASASARRRSGRARTSSWSPTSSPATPAAGWRR